MARCAARGKEKRKGKNMRANAQSDVSTSQGKAAMPLQKKDDTDWVRRGAWGLFAVVGMVAIWITFFASTAPTIKNIRICDEFYFDTETHKCSQHVSVFVDGIEEVFLSFDFENVPEGMPFERWWILNSERVAGRTSFNDDAWPGYTFWRPEGGLKVGQYVVRLIVDDNVETQTFYVQQDGFYSTE